MVRGGEDLFDVAGFDDLAAVHDGDSFGDARDDAEVMRDEEHGQAESLAEVVEEIENLCLDGDVERCGGFVGDEELRAVDEHHCDHDALSHAAGELVWIVAGAAFVLRDCDFAHGIDGAAPGFGFCDASVRENGFGDLVADAHDRVERGHWLLKDHGYVSAADGAHGGFRKLEKIERRFGASRLVGSLDGGRKENASGGAGLRGEQSHDGERGDGFAGAGFTDESEDFAGLDAEGDAADGMGERSGAAGVCGENEIDVEICYLQQGSGQAAMVAGVD
ncbi:MAG: hypothetical protein JWO13_280 [Acidobacteriales bacterium]|nr:hypothetical protein [Terriglobales bacterium]